MSECVGCGCTDEAACPGGCHWLAQFSDGTGVCSNCPEWLDEDLAGVEERPAGLILPGDPEFDIRLSKTTSRYKGGAGS